MTGRVALEGRGHSYSGNVLADPEYRATGLSARRSGTGPPWACRRSCARGASIGAFFLSGQRVRPFTDRQIELVKNFAAQAVIAIEDVLMPTNELRQRTDDLV